MTVLPTIVALLILYMAYFCGPVVNAINHFIILNDFPCKRFNLVINYSFYCHYHFKLWPRFLGADTRRAHTHIHNTFPLLSQRILTAISSVVTNLLELIQERANVLHKTYEHTSSFYLVHSFSDWNEIVRNLASFRVDNFHSFVVQLQGSSVRSGCNTLELYAILENDRETWGKYVVVAANRPLKPSTLAINQQIL